MTDTGYVINIEGEKPPALNMPYKVEEKDGEYLVINEDTGEVKAHHDDRESAERQVRLLEAIEHDADFTPRKDQ